MNCLASLPNILAAPQWIDPVFLASPLLEGTPLDRSLGCGCLLKLETQNPVGSFKGRGTEVLAATALRPGEPVVCASAGNFGQGLARAALRRGHVCTVFAAANANPVKIEAIRRFGAQVSLVGADFDAAKQAAVAYARDHGLRYVEDGAEAAIAEGAGTIALELVAPGGDPGDVILVPLGNGALLAGIGTVLRAHAPQTRILSVVASDAPAMKLSIDAGHVVETAHANTIADGIAVRVPIASTLGQLRTLCDEVVAVDDAAILRAMRLVYRDLGVVLEPAGAAGVGYLVSNPQRFKGQRVITILSGGNISKELREQL
jgi:threonine dehydratase